MDKTNNVDDEFIAKLADTSTDAKPENEVVSAEKHVEKTESFNDTMKDIQPNTTEQKVEKEEVKTEEKVEKPVSTPKKNAKKGKKVEITNNIDPNSIKVDKTDKKVSFKANDSENSSKNVDKTVEIADDLDKRAIEQNESIMNDTDDSEYDSNEILNETVSSYINKNYDSDEETESTKSVKVVSAIKDKESTKKISKSIDKELTREEKLRNNHIYGGDGKTSAFRIRRSRVSKILGEVNVSDTTAIDPVDISKKSNDDKLYIYANKVAPILNPRFTVVPLVISGVVITMSAFSWPDIREICLIDEKKLEFDPKDDDYITKLNQNFIERRKKQLDLFYNHIISVSGYENKPTQEDFYGKIVKFPDFQQLFFAAYSATFQKSYPFTIVCPRCGYEQTRNIDPKSLCFMLNKNISIDKFNYYLKQGSAVSNTDESAKAFKEFREERLVEKSNAIYRTKKPLSDSAIVCTLKVPTITEAMERLEQIVDVFPDKPLEHILDDGTTISIDSTFGVTAYPDLRDLRKYLYINSILAAIPEDEDADSDKIEVGYFEFKNVGEIIDVVSKLSAIDYKELISDPNLNAIASISGIRHQYDPKKCENKTCGQEIGLNAIEPETLFFTIAKQELPN